MLDQKKDKMQENNREYLREEDYEKFFSHESKEIQERLGGDSEKILPENLAEMTDDQFWRFQINSFLENLEESAALYKQGDQSALPISAYLFTDMMKSKISFKPDLYRRSEREFMSKNFLEQKNVTRRGIQGPMERLTKIVQQTDEIILRSLENTHNMAETLMEMKDMEIPGMMLPNRLDILDEVINYSPFQIVEGNEYDAARSILVPPVCVATESKIKMEDAVIVAKKRNIGIYQVFTDYEERQEESRKVVIGKIMYVRQMCSVLPVVIAEDTSFEIDSMGGFPGYAGKHMCECMTVQQIYNMVVSEDKSAQVRYVMGVGIRGDPEIKIFEKIVRGRLVPPVGLPGYGWDQIFLPDNSVYTVSNMKGVFRASISRQPLFNQAFQYIETKLGIKRFLEPPWKVNLSDFESLTSYGDIIRNFMYDIAKHYDIIRILLEEGSMEWVWDYQEDKSALIIYINYPGMWSKRIFYATNREGRIDSLELLSKFLINLMSEKAIENGRIVRKETDIVDVSKKVSDYMLFCGDSSGIVWIKSRLRKEILMEFPIHEYLWYDLRVLYGKNTRGVFKWLLLKSIYNDKE